MTQVEDYKLDVRSYCQALVNPGLTDEKLIGGLRNYKNLFQGEEEMDMYRKMCSNLKIRLDWFQGN